MNRIAAVVAGLSLAFVGTANSQAADVTLHPGDSIQDAINNSSSDDTITLLAGTFNQSNLNTTGLAITIQGTLNSDGTLATTIDAQQGGSVFVIGSGETSGTVIQDLVITGGTGTDQGSWTVGGGIYCSDSNPTITGCTIKGNSVSVNGGGIYCSGSNPTITGCTIESNSAGNNGGGIYCNESFPVFTGCTIESNSAGKLGGGISCESFTATISNSDICGNVPEQINGSWMSGGGNDIATTCPVAPTPTGACCLGGTCITATEPDCTAAGGTYAGDDVACADAGCSPIHPDVNNNGCVDIDDLLYVIEEWGEGCTP